MKKLAFFLGKGGVGKTTISSSVASQISREGRKVLIVSLDPAHNLGDVFGARLTDARTSLGPRLDGIEIDLAAWVSRYLKESREEIVKTMKAVLAQGELADLAAEDLRKWQIWDLTGDVLKQYARKGTDSPLMRRAIIRYALCAPAGDKDAQGFVKARRADEADVVQEVEEGLAIEREASKK